MLYNHILEISYISFHLFCATLEAIPVDSIHPGVKKGFIPAWCPEWICPTLLSGKNFLQFGVQKGFTRPWCSASIHENVMKLCQNSIY